MIYALRANNTLYRTLLLAALSGVLLAGCVAKGQVHRNELAKLAPGMTYEEIILTLGEPESSKLTGDDWILTYYFHDSLYLELMPYALVLDKNSRRLKSWAVDQERQRRDEATAAKVSAAFGVPPQSGSTGAAVTGPAGQAAHPAGGVAGSYWGYTSGATSAASGGTQFRVLLCQNGTFGIFSQSSYSGTEGGSNPSMRYGVMGGADWQGTWRADGASLIFNYSDGSQEPVRYGPEEPCLYFRNGATACYQGSPGC